MFRLFSRVIDLDRDVLPRADLECVRGDDVIFDVDSPASRRQIRLFTNVLLNQVLKDRAVALNVFHDREDDCLRILMYLQRGNAEIEPFELVPAVGYMAQPVLHYLARSARMRRTDLAGRLDFVYGGTRASAHCETNGPDELRVYFGAARPNMRTKLSPAKSSPAAPLSGRARPSILA